MISSDCVCLLLAAVGCLFVAVMASAMVHRICATTWYEHHSCSVQCYPSLSPSLSPHTHASIIFSLVALYYINKVSQSTSSSSISTTPATQGRQTKKSKSKK